MALWIGLRRNDTLNVKPSVVKECSDIIIRCLLQMKELPKVRLSKRALPIAVDRLQR